MYGATWKKHLSHEDDDIKEHRFDEDVLRLLRDLGTEASIRRGTVGVMRFPLRYVGYICLNAYDGMESPSVAMSSYSSDKALRLAQKSSGLTAEDALVRIRSVLDEEQICLGEQEIPLRGPLADTIPVLEKKCESGPFQCSVHGGPFS